MASGTLHHFSFAFLHLKYFGMAVGAFELLLIDVGSMAKCYRPRASSRFKSDVASAHFFLLSVAHANGDKAEDTNDDNSSFAKSLIQVLPSFPVDDLARSMPPRAL